MNDMYVNNSLLTSVDEVMDAKFGKVGTPERKTFRREAYTYYRGQIFRECQKEQKNNSNINGKTIVIGG